VKKAEKKVKKAKKDDKKKKKGKKWKRDVGHDGIIENYIHLWLLFKLKYYNKVKIII
jgi:hypothetical protein